MTSEMAAYFDRLAPNWDNSPADYDTRERLTAMMGLPQGSVIADVGCGKGVMIEHLLKTEPQQIIAVDISAEMIRHGKTLIDDLRVEFINGDFYEVSFPRLDAVVFFNSYPHFIDKGSLADKLAQIIKEGGTLVIAHSFGRVDINGKHDGVKVSTLSTPLESAQAEADKYSRDFVVDALVDNEDMYLVKLIRR